MNRDMTNGQQSSGTKMVPGLVRLLCLAGLAFAGCTEPNPRYCDATEDCPEGKHCDLSVHRCVPTECGNGVVEGREDCDGQALNNRTCADESDYLHGQLACTAQCEFDISQCHTCGNGAIEGSENCDGTDLGGSDCAAHGLQHGQLVCSDQCAFDLSHCHTCGNGVVEGPESCDGPALSNQTCQTLGHTGGSLSCGADCSFDESGCFDCGDGACHQSAGETVQNCPADCGWIDVSAGGAHACAAKGDGTVWCWGSNGYDQLGDGQTHQTCGGFDCSRSPVPVPNVVDAVAVSSSWSGSCVLRSDGTVRCWGANRYGRVGDGTTTDRPTPVEVTGIDSVISISARSDHSCAIKSDNTLWCWGYNNYGQLGDNAVHQDCGGSDCSPVPVQVPGLSGVVSVATGSGFACAVRDNGTVWCWGINSSGQLGDGATHQTCGSYDCSPVPVHVTNLQDAVLVAAGNWHVCAAKTDGTVWCWGRNNWGQLGDNSTVDRSTPVPVFGLGSAVSMDAATAHTCAVKADGTAWCWGRNANGECGTGDTGDKSVPEQVWVLTNAEAVSTGGSSTCALESDGNAFCWGLNVDGQLGDGNTADYSLTPVQVIDPYQ